MRIIAGEWKGLSLAAPTGQVARPTTDRVKEAMFNLLGFSWEGGVAVDLFAGSGALGLEALSRGADMTVFADTHPASLAAIHDNIGRCRAEDRTRVWKTDWNKAWNKVIDENYDVGWVFVDPPYAKNMWEDVLHTIAEGSRHPRFGIVCEHPKTVVLPETVEPFEVAKTRGYGDIAITIYRVRSADMEGVS